MHSNTSSFRYQQRHAQQLSIREGPILRDSLRDGLLGELLLAQAPVFIFFFTSQTSIWPLLLQFNYVLWPNVSTSQPPNYLLTTPHQCSISTTDFQPTTPYNFWGSYPSSGGAFSWGSSFLPPPISFSWGPPLILFTEQLRPPPPPVLGIKCVGERGRGGAGGAWVGKKKSRTEAMP